MMCAVVGPHSHFLSKIEERANNLIHIEVNIISFRAKSCLSISCKNLRIQSCLNQGFCQNLKKI